MSKDSSLTYYTLLTVMTNGSAVARVRYIEPSSGEKKLAEINFLDSTDIADGQQHFLIPDGDPLPIECSEISNFHSPRFVFKKQYEGSDIYDAPDAIFYQFPDGSWRVSEQVVSQQKSNTELKKEVEFVTIFYNEMDEFYKYLFEMSPYYRSPVKRKEKIYLITVANTLDSKIGTSSMKDMSNILASFTKLAYDVNMDMHVVKIMDKAFSRQTIELTLAKLHPSPIDIVIFYYSGHGFRYSDDKSDYPRMSLRVGKTVDINKNNLSVEAIYRLLLRKNARVTLMLSDCCNDDIGAVAPSGSVPITTKSPPESFKPALNVSVFNQLFAPGKPTAIIVSSAERNQLAVGNPKIGGYFTSVFTAELLKTLYGVASNDTWLRLLASTKKQASWRSLAAECAPKVRCVQTARFDFGAMH